MKQLHVRIVRQVGTSRGLALPGAKLVLLPAPEAKRLAAGGHVEIVSDDELDSHRRQLDAVQAEFDRRHQVARVARDAADARSEAGVGVLDRALDASRSPSPTPAR